MTRRGIPIARGADATHAGRGPLLARRAALELAGEHELPVGVPQSKLVNPTAPPM